MIPDGKGNISNSREKGAGTTHEPSDAGVLSREQMRNVIQVNANNDKNQKLVGESNGIERERHNLELARSQLEILEDQLNDSDLDVEERKTLKRQKRAKQNFILALTALKPTTPQSTDSFVTPQTVTK